MIYVGADAYKKAGGIIPQDLFEQGIRTGVA
jgi:hypothetical protein